MALPSDRNLRKSSTTQREAASITKKDSNVVSFHSLCDFVYGCHSDRMKVCGRWFFFLSSFWIKAPLKRLVGVSFGTLLSLAGAMFTNGNCHWASYTLMRKRSKESVVRASLDANSSKYSRLWEISVIWIISTKNYYGNNFKQKKMWRVRTKVVPRLLCMKLTISFSNWPKAHSELFSKSAPETSSNCRLYNYHVKDTQGQG